MKKLLLTLIVALGMCGSIFAQYESNWPDFNGNYFPTQGGIVATIMINGEIIDTDAPNWNALEVAAFVGEECRGNGMYMSDEYVLEYGDPYPILNGLPIYYETAGEQVSFMMYDHANGVLYETCEILHNGEPMVILTGEDHFEGWWEPENPIFLNFTTSAACKISLNAPDYTYFEDFEGYEVTTTTHPYTFVTPECWTVAHQYHGGSMDNIGEGADTLPQLYRSFNHTPGGQYSLRIKFRSILAMPELDESVDMSRLRLKMYVRQPHYYYNLEVGVMEDLDDESTFVPVALVHNRDYSLTYFECGFNNYDGNGRYIAFRNVGGSETDPYCSNYLDDITLTYSYTEEGGCDMTIPHTEDFEGIVPEDLAEVEGGTGVEPPCWELITEDANMNSYTKPQLYKGFNMGGGELSDNGDYSLRLKNRCVYAMPALSSDYDIHSLTMTFNLRQAKLVYRLQVGVLDADNNFDVVKTFNFRPENSVQRVSVDFADYPGEGNRIAFRNTLGHGSTIDYSTNFIDSIYIDETSKIGNVTAGNAIESDDMNAYLESIEVYPNPTTGLVQIEAVDVQKVECYSQMGQLVGVYENVNELNLGEFADGVYMLRITVPQGVTMRKVVKR